jgi:hypothetical protein
MMSKRPTSQPAPARPATALHNRVSSPHVVDLRPKPISAAKPDAPSPIEHQSTQVPAAPPKQTLKNARAEVLKQHLEKAKSYQRSAVISRFSHDERAVLQAQSVLNPLPASSRAQLPPPAKQPHPTRVAQETRPSEPQLPSLAVVQHEAMAKLASHAPKPVEKRTRRERLAPKRVRSISPRASRSIATGAIVVIMAGYVWAQNYPKMALQNASSQAGVSASLPGFMPSSYSLARTISEPGQITLNYTSPSEPSALEIAQSKSTWDSNSLLANFVSKNTDDYAAVQGEGLTIYLFNNNEATWINHGIWYNIQGATLLSRDQILKIAYSL